LTCDGLYFNTGAGYILYRIIQQIFIVPLASMLGTKASVINPPYSLPSSTIPKAKMSDLRKSTPYETEIASVFYQE
jgi:hypothetical protein